VKKLYKNPIGSTWRKWDLHIHSTFSKESKAKLTVKDIFNQAIEKDISVIAITDHSNVEALDEAWKLHDLTFEKNGETYAYNNYIEFIPGVELKTDKGNKPIHLIALFPKSIQRDGYEEKVDTSFLKSEFLSKISCSDSDIRKAGGGDYNKGLLEIQVDFEQTCAKARELGGITIVHNGSKSNGFDKGLQHSAGNPTEEEILTTFNTLKEKLMTECVDVCEIPTLNESNIRDKDFYLKRFNKPFILCSDSHSEYKGEKCTWIKADPTFEGLKQIIFEPKSRIYFGDNPPLDPLYRIDKITFDFPSDTKLGDEDFCLTGSKDLYFSPNLTCMIGGRGSGKSTILNLIHEKLQPSQNRFFNKHILELNNDKSLSDCIKIDDDNDEKYIEFLSQNEIEEFALDHGKFTKAIFSRLYKLDDSSELSKCSRELSTHITEFDKIIDSYAKLKMFKKTHANFVRELKTHEKVVSSLEDERYTIMTKKVQKIDIEAQNLSSSKEKLRELIKDLEALIKKNKIEMNTSNLYDEYYQSIIESIEHKLSDVKTKENYKEIKALEEELQEELKKARNELNQFLEERGLTGENLKDISEANYNINRHKRLIQEVEEDIKQTDKEIEEFTHNRQYKIDYEEKITNMLNGLNRNLEMLNEHVKTIELKYEFNNDKAKEVLISKITDKFPKHQNFDNLRTNNVEKYLFCIEPWELTTQKQLLVAMAEKGDKTKTYQSLNEFFSDELNFHIYKLLIDQVFSDVEQFKMIKVFYDGKPLEKTSFGQRCTAAIVVLLLLGNNPIIIDEPEAHLDSSLIADYLVDLIKESKLKRQIIFATHNANFVINGDAELIHYLDMGDDKKTTISHLTIEDKKYRDKLLRLEGGQRAFEQREKRYQFK
jgi:exonuclease SbcC